MVLRGLILFGFFGFALSAKPQLAIRSTGKIMGGVPVNISSVPYQISIFYRMKYFCGGSIISKSHVLSTAQCSAYSYLPYYGIRAGSTYSNTGGTLFPISIYVRHPLFNGTTLDYNLAIFTIIGTFTFGNTINVIPYATVEAPAGTQATVSGWGSATPGGPIQTSLQTANVTVVDRKICAANYSNYGAVTNSMVCASAPGKDSCSGDSGSALVAVVSNQLVQIGIVSWGNGCGQPGYPGVYTNLGLNTVNSWIGTIIGAAG